jgi:hypothetical protein
MVIIEGCDNSGKSTLARKLNLEFNLKIIKSSGPPISKEDLVQRVEASIENTKRGNIFIYDRYPLISEFVYGPLLRNKNLLEGEEGNRLWKELILINPFIVYCRPPYTKIADFGKRKQMRGVRSKADLLIVAYDNFMNRIGGSTDVYFYNYMDNKDLEIYIKIREYLKGVGYRWSI